MDTKGIDDAVNSEHFSLCKHETLALCASVNERLIRLEPRLRRLLYSDSAIR